MMTKAPDGTELEEHEKYGQADIVTPDDTKVGLL